MVGEGQLLWTPSPEFVERSNVAQYLTWLKESHRIEVADYEGLRKWLVTDIRRFSRLRQGHPSNGVRGRNIASVKNI